MQLSSYLLLALDVALPLLLFSGLSFLFLMYRRSAFDNPGYFPGFLVTPGILIHPQSKEGRKLSEVTVKQEDSDEEEVKKALVFTAEEVNTITANIEELMKNTPFLKHRYSIRDMASQLEIPSYQLSAFINQNMGINFNDFINKERIAYCIRLINEGQIEGLNLFGLSDKCGFSNRNTFRNAFKKFTGQTPSIFIKDNN